MVSFPFSDDVQQSPQHAPTSRRSGDLVLPNIEAWAIAGGHTISPLLREWHDGADLCSPGITAGRESGKH